MAEVELSSLFATNPADEVWGVGRCISERLHELGIETVRDLRDADAEKIRARFSDVLERTVRELCGVSCLDLEEIAPPKQQIMSNRSFGRYVYDLDELREAVVSYIAKAGEKLRAQDSLAGAVQGYIHTNPFQPKEPQYQRAVTLPLPEPTADTRVLSRFATHILKGIYRPGYAYQKAGVMLTELQPRQLRQKSLLADEAEDERVQSVVKVMDSINAKWGRGTVRLSAEGLNKAWQMRRGQFSPAYTTCWLHPPVAKAI